MALVAPSLQVEPQMSTERSSNDDLEADFREWRAMGDGGASPTWAGYLSQLAAEQVISYDNTLSADIYQHPDAFGPGWEDSTPREKAATQQSFLSTPLPMREGPRARAKHFVFPQRERNADEPLDPHIEEAYKEAFHQLGETNKAKTEWKISALERHGTALFLRDSEPVTSLAAPAGREICHVHTSDHSGHVTLSFADAQEVIAKGWGERHRLSGTPHIHLGYTMVYVPRTVEETEVMVRIFQAGLDYMRSC